MREHHDTVVIGGGQAGLAMSFVLQQHGREHVVLERGQVGGRWRTERWESLRFQFPNWSLELPGYGYSGDYPQGFAHWREILGVIEDYAESARATVREHTSVTQIRAEEDGFVVAVAGGTIHARHVVVATGPFQRPRIPPFSRDIASSVLQTDPTRYRRPEDLPDGAVLVVGSGASGCQIGDELLRGGRTVYLSVSRHRRVPRRFRGQDVYWWLERMGRFATTIDSFPGRQWPPSIVVTGVSGGYDINVRQMAADGIRVLGRVLDASAGTLAVARNANDVLNEADAAFADFIAAAREFTIANPNLELADEEPTDSAVFAGTVPEVESFDLRRENVAAIVWATGYDYDYGWLTTPVFDVHGRPLQQRGITPQPTARPLLPWPALDAHDQVRPLLRRWQRRAAPRRPHGSHDETLTAPRRLHAEPSRHARTHQLHRGLQFVGERQPAHAAGPGLHLVGDPGKALGFDLGSKPCATSGRACGAGRAPARSVKNPGRRDRRRAVRYRRARWFGTLAVTQRGDDRPPAAARSVRPSAAIDSGSTDVRMAELMRHNGQTLAPV